MILKISVETDAKTSIATSVATSPSASITAKPLRWFSILFFVLLNTACVVGPDYKRPKMNLPTNYKQTNDKNQTTKSTPAISQIWWTAYADQKLNQLIEQVEVHNYALQSVAARVRQARAVANQAKAKKLPWLIAGGKNDFGLVAAWEVDLWGRIERSIEASGAAAQASLADLAAAKLSLQAQLAQNYFLLRLQDADINLLTRTLESYRRSLQIAQNQYDVGIVDRGTIAQAQAQLSTTQAVWLDAKITRAKLEHSLATLIGKAPADFSLVVEPAKLQVPEIPQTLPAELLQRRPDIAASERRMAAASAQIGVAKAEAYPSLNLLAGVRIVKNLVGGGELIAPLYTGGSLSARSDQAVAAYQKSVADYKQAVLNGLREVEDNLVTLELLAQASDAQNNAITANRKVVEIMKNQYKVGIITYQAIIIAQATALADERRALAILSRRLTASVNLINALGGGWDVKELEGRETNKNLSQTKSR